MPREERGTHAYPERESGACAHHERERRVYAPRWESKTNSKGSWHVTHVQTRACAR